MDNIENNQFITDEIIKKSICSKNEYLELVSGFDRKDNMVIQFKIMDFRQIATRQDQYEIDLSGDYQIIVFDYSFNGIMNFNILNLPSSLKMVNFQSFEILDYDYLPIDLRVLNIDINYDKPLINLPPNLEILIYNNCYNESIDELPDSLICIMLGYHFNKPILKLPSKLKYFKFGPNYNNILPAKIFPKTIKKIYIPYMTEGAFSTKPSKTFLERHKIFANYGDLFKKYKLIYY